MKKIINPEQKKALLLEYKEKYATLGSRFGDLSLLAEPVFRQAVYHAVFEIASEIVHSLAK